MRTRSGVDKGSVENIAEKFKLFSLFCDRRLVGKKLMRRLQVVMLIHTFLSLESQVRGNSMSDGK